MAMSRRGFLGLTGGIGLTASLGLAGCGFASRGGTLGERLTSRLPLPRPFSAALPLPPVARVVRSTADADHYEITQRKTSAKILPGVRTLIFGYDGIFPGPTIESRRGRRSVVRHHNDLPVPVVVHLHGGHTPAEHDGLPTDLVLPGTGPSRSHPRRGSMS